MIPTWKLSMCKLSGQTHADRDLIISILYFYFYSCRRTEPVTQHFFDDVD